MVKFLLLTRTIPECRRIFALSVILWQKYKRRKFDWSANRLYTLAWRRYCRFEKAGLWSRFQKVRDECWLSPRKTVKNGKEIRPKRIFTVYTTNLITGIYVKIKMVRPQGLEPWTQWLRVICSTDWAMGASLISENAFNIPERNRKSRQILKIIWFFIRKTTENKKTIPYDS